MQHFVSTHFPYISLTNEDHSLKVKYWSNPGIKLFQINAKLINHQHLLLNFIIKQLVGLEEESTCQRTRLWPASLTHRTNQFTGIHHSTLESKIQDLSFPQSTHLENSTPKRFWKLISVILSCWCNRPSRSARPPGSTFSINNPTFLSQRSQDISRNLPTADVYCLYYYLYPLLFIRNYTLLFICTAMHAALETSVCIIHITEDKVRSDRIIVSGYADLKKWIRKSLWCCHQVLHI